MQYLIFQNLFSFIIMLLMFIHIVAYHCFKLLYNIQIWNFILLSYLLFDMLPPKSSLRTYKSPLVTSIFQCEAYPGIKSLNKTLPDSLNSYMGILTD